MRYAICMWKWKMVWKWALSCMCCLHYCIVMLDLFCSGCAALSFTWSYQIIWRKRRHFNTFNATYCSIVTANHIKQLLYLYINSHSRLPAMEEKWSSLIVYTTECYVSLISYFFFLSFLLRLGSFFHWSSVAFHHSCIISYDINEIKAERWKYHLMPCTMETLMHIIWHDYFAHLTGFIFKSGVCVCVCAGRILTFRLRDQDCILNLPVVLTHVMIYQRFIVCIKCCRAIFFDFIFMITQC